MRMNGEKDEFLFLEKLEREEVVFILSKGRLVDGDESVNSKRIIESIDR